MAEHAVPADRFAHKIVQFLMSACAARLQQLNGNPLAGNPSGISAREGLLPSYN
jgi:hypothetical protein